MQYTSPPNTFCHIQSSTFSTPITPHSTAAEGNCKTNTDYVMNQVFWIGVYPGLTREMLDFIVKTAVEFVAGAKSGLNAV